MFASLLTTKFFFPPARRNLVPRPRLIERLNTGLHVPLTLLCAPAGYGKTTLLSEWRAGMGHNVPAAWLSLDASDCDLVLFLRYLTAALETLQPGLVGRTALLLQSPQPPSLDAILTSLVNDVSGLTDDSTLILDDYHVIRTLAIHDAVSFLLAHAPPQMHLVLLTREDPPLPLPKLRARGQMVEIREADLRFSPEETAAFLAQTMGLALSEETVAGLVTRTEGWVAGLQMAGLSLQKGKAAQEFVAAFQGEDRYVMDYFMDEVFRQQSDQVQGFLLRTSILERLYAPLCDAVLGGEQDCASTPDAFASSQHVLEYLDRANLFVLPQDNRREWYRYHHLFADLLRYRLQREYPERLPELQRRACRWYAQAGSPDEAMRHALAVPDYDLAADLAEQFAVQMIGGSRLSTYLSWIQQFPKDLVRRRAYLCAACGWATVLTHQTEAAVRYVEAGEAALPQYGEPVSNLPDGRRISREEVHGNLSAIRSYADREMGDLGTAIAHAHQALQMLPREALAIRCAAALSLGFLHWDCGQTEMARQAFGEAFEAAQESRENVYVAISALGSLGSIAAMSGKLNEAEGLFCRAIQYGTGESGVAMPVPAVGLVHGWLALLHYQRNEIETAQQHLDIVLPAAEQMGDPQAIVRAYLYQALLSQSRGEFSSAEGWFQRAEQIMQPCPLQDVIQTEWIVFRGQFHLAQGDIVALLALLSAQEVESSDLDDQPASGSEQARWLGARLGRYPLLARALLARGAPDRATELLERVCTIAESYSDVSVLLEALALRAIIAYHHQGDVALALLYLERALDLAAPEGHVRPFLHAGMLLAKPLRQAIVRGIQAAYAQGLLAELSDQERRQTGAQRPAARPEGTPFGATALFEPLTERERQVLRLLAAGLSSTEVAEELVIAVSTSRSYIKSLYGKLDAHSRDEATEKGHQYGLI